MQTIYLNNKDKWNNIGPLTLSIGNFDGVHLGHQALIKNLHNFSDTKLATMSFSPHPSIFFNKEGFKTVITVKKKIDLMAKQNLDYFLLVDFTKDFANLTINEFILKLKELGVVRLVLGADFRFGTKGSGNVDDLKNDFEVLVLNDVNNESGSKISTTYIKSLLELGKIEEANELLGFNFEITGNVEHGNKVGRTLGFPTANIDYEDNYLPSKGVYFVLIYIKGNKHYGICNIGNNPTVNYSKLKKMEVYILDYNDQIYNEEVRVEFIHKIREELKFNSVNELISEINNDEIITRKLIKLLKV